MATITNAARSAFEEVAQRRSGLCTALDPCVDGRTLEPSRDEEVEEERDRSTLDRRGRDPEDRPGGGTAGNAPHTSRGTHAVMVFRVGATGFEPVTSAV